MDKTRAHLELSKVLLEGQALEAALDTLAADIIRTCGERPALVGVRTRGVPLAERIRSKIQEKTGEVVALGALDITLYRDDVFQGLSIPEVGLTELPFEVEGTCILLVDDVLYTGRTVRAALDAIMDFGRPKWIRLVTLVDRGHRELPIRPDYCALTIETQSHESVEVRLTELDGEDRVAVFCQRRAE